jgi:hypothetical protein
MRIGGFWTRAIILNWVTEESRSELGVVLEGRVADRQEI